MNELRIFNNEDFGEIRTVTIDGEAWFIGNDVGRALGYADPRSGVRKLVDDEDKRVCPVGTGNVETTIINESGIYALIFGSTLPTAKKFKKWVTSEVLPAIRKTGGYQLPQTTDGKIQLLAQGQVEMGQRIDKVEKTIQTMREELPLFPIELKKITAAVKKKGVEVLGGKESEAYRDRSVSCRVYQDIYREIYRNFEVSSYQNIRRADLPRVESVVLEYTPPIVLSDLIREKNAS